MPTRIRFDDSLAALAAAIRETLGYQSLERTTALRDTSGRLAAFVDQDLGAEAAKRAAMALADRLGAYARQDSVLADRSEPGA